MNKISEMVTDLVRGYMAHGFSLYLGENARGSQSKERFATYLTKDNGKTVVKVYGETRRGEDFSYKLAVVVELFEEDRWRSAFWNGRGDTLSEKVFYIYESEKGRELYLDTEEEYKALRQLRRERDRAQNEKPVELTSDKAKKIALNLVRKRKGFKSTALKDIQKVVRRDSCYFVVIDGKGRISIFLKQV